MQANVQSKAVVCGIYRQEVMCVCVCERQRESVCVCAMCVPSPCQLWREKKARKRGKERVISVGIGFQQHYYD